MDIENPSVFRAAGSLESACGAALLGRLGRELANVYGDLVDAPLPPKLRHLIDRLDAALAENAYRKCAPDDCDQAAS